MFNPFSRSPLTAQDWQERARLFQEQINGLSIDELMRGVGTDGAKLGEPSGLGGHHYDPNQPRVPAGHSDGGQWTARGVGHSEIDDPRIVSDATPDNYWIPGERYVGDGHHFPPRATWRSLPLQPETRRIFNRAVSGPIPLRMANPSTGATTFYHQWDKTHERYNGAVSALIENHMRRHGITAEAMTPIQAQKIVEAIHASRDPRIREYNEIVKILARLYRMRMRGNE